MTITTENIWNEFHKELSNFIKRTVKDTDTTNDILQDIFIKIHLKLDTLTNQDKLTSWLYQITRNSIFDNLKKHKPQSEFLDVFFSPIEEQIHNFNNEISPCMLRLINHLPDNYKDAILETELGQLSQKNMQKKQECHILVQNPEYKGPDNNFIRCLKIVVEFRQILTETL